METLTYTGKVVIVSCGHPDCAGQYFGMAEEFYEQKRRDHTGWYCPRGHSRVYSGKSDEEQLKQEIQQKQESINYLREANGKLHTKITNLNYSVRAQKAAKTKIMNRIKNGVCPCCNRTFQDLQNHFKTKHPELL